MVDVLECELFVVGVIPFVDVRELVIDETGRTTVPFWRDPGFGDEFVRGFGPLRPRPRRGVRPWVGEANYVESRRGVKFAVDGLIGPDESYVRPLYRRLYSDGVVGRLEVGFHVAWRGRASASSAPTVWDAIAPSLSTAATMPIKIGRTGPVIELAASGGRLSQVVLRSTTSTRRQPDYIRTWWVTPGAPAFLHEARTDEVALSSHHRARVESKVRGWSGDGVLVSQRWLPYKAQRLSAWSLVSGAAATETDGRQLRLHAVRVHTGLEAFRAVLRLISAGKLAPEQSTRLRDFLDGSAKLLLRRRRHGFPNRDVIRRVLDTVEDAYSDELAAIDHLWEYLESKGLRGQLNDIGTMFSRATSASHMSVFVMTEGSLVQVDNSIDNSVDISGGTVGQAQAGQANTQRGDVHLSTTGIDVTGLVLALQEAMGAIGPSLPAALADDGYDLVTVVGQEVAQLEPDVPRVKRWLTKLNAWAEETGEAAAPILTAVAALLAALK